MVLAQQWAELLDYSLGGEQGGAKVYVIEDDKVLFSAKSTKSSNEIYDLRVL